MANTIYIVIIGLVLVLLIIREIRGWGDGKSNLCRGYGKRWK